METDQVLKGLIEKPSLLTLQTFHDRVFLTAVAALIAYLINKAGDDMFDSDTSSGDHLGGYFTQCDYPTTTADSGQCDNRHLVCLKYRE